ncbi:AraC family transcriptional regulator [Reyranella sp. CPCC 100927]|uniref:AraC family transcriptional regulator n=1 Tax=Reyranella sp. CPCC 100927 TaxID=2599616 RepID=UPI0011B737D6|nr:AraC family transcriptional regulator [Reyranella sp. CPCC 100927]TWT09672.1 AraC family transcriptional regulator [Reyranella sp. CPCC 100927]
MASLTVASTWMNAVLDRMAREGLDRAELTADIRGIEQGRISTTARIEIQLSRLIWRRAVQMTDDPLLGLKVGSQLPTQAGNVVSVIRAHSPTFGDFIQSLLRYQSLLSEGGRWLALRPVAQGVRLTYRQAPSAIAMEPQQIDSAVASLVAYGPRALSVRLTGRGNQDPAAFSAMLGCPVTLGGAQASVDYAHATMTQPTSGADPALLSLNMAYAESLLAAHRTMDALCGNVRVAIERLGPRHATIDSVARHIGCSPRTLQRRLAAAGSSFKAIFDGHRMEEAHILLSKSAASVAQISERLGYSEASAFSRAVTAWWGVSPRQLRRVVLTS